MVVVVVGAVETVENFVMIGETLEIYPNPDP
jgi:hypothetical protein